MSYPSAALRACCLALATGVASPVWGASTERVSLGPGGVQANDGSFRGAISGDGRFVAFVSVASNLVPGDGNGTDDVFVRDWRTGRTERANVGPGGVEMAPLTFVDDSVGISADGRFVAFAANAANLVAGDTNGVADVFVRDRRAGRTQRVSLGPGGVEADGASVEAAISADGRFVAFVSFATNLVAGDSNAAKDVFVRDRQTGRTRRVSVGPGGAQASGVSERPVISANGRFVAFVAFAADLVPGDTNARSDVFVRDRWRGRTERVSVGPGGVQANGYSAGSSSHTLSISADGRFVGFNSEATNLVAGDTNRRDDVFLRDRARGRTERVSVGARGVQAAPCRSFERCSAEQPSLSADGRFVAFSTDAGNLVPGDTNGFADVFVRDRRTARTELVSRGPGGAQANLVSIRPALTADGRLVAFVSDASNLVPGDTNEVIDVFVRVR